MNTAESVNFQSLSVVGDELSATIEQAGRDLEVFVASDGDGDNSILPCVKAVKQILGIFRLLEFKGASILAEELLITVSALTADADRKSKPFEKRIELISRTLYVLGTYLDYVRETHRKLPVLLIPYINALRKARKEAVLPESYFFTANLTKVAALPPIEPIVVNAKEFRPLLSRLRHMYQLGLLGVLQDKSPVPSLGLMRRALVRLQRLGGDKKPLTLLWWLANITIVVIVKQKLELIETRKMLLSRIDRVIRQVETGGVAAYQAAPPKGLIKELLYILSLSGQNSETIKALQRVYEIAPLPYLEADLLKERKALSGPGQQTISSLSHVLQTELSHAKKVIEMAGQGAQIIDDIDGLVDTLKKISETLSVVGLTSACATLKREIARVESWRTSSADGVIEEDQLTAVANTMLYLESSLSSMNNMALSKGDGETDDAAQHKMINMSELVLAERIVIQESEAGLSLTKRAISSYSESNFDSGHIRNISKTLTTLWGGMVMLGQFRAAEVLARCVEFVDEVLMQQDLPPALKEMLETYADAIIGVEYYLDTADSAASLDESVLHIAEESLAALGFPSQYSGS